MWDGRLRVNGYDVTDRMPLTMAILREQEAKMEEVKHSSLGASSAERWMNCPGSTALIEAYQLPETDEPEYRKQGIAGHAAAADCLARDVDAWEIVGDTYEDYIISAEMGEAIQSYLDRVRPSIGGGPAKGRYHGEQFFIEAKLAAPDIHEKMFGTVDFGALVPDTKIPAEEAGRDNVFKEGFLDITDLKMGQGITVEAYDNPQMKYYGFMLIHTKFKELPDDFPVRLSIVQPRAFHPDGPIREWWTTVGYIKAWVVADLLPAMHSTDRDLQAGEWCRFCPAKLTCPMVRSLFLAATTYDPNEVIEVSDDALGESYKLTKGRMCHMASSSTKGQTASSGLRRSRKSEAKKLRSQFRKRYGSALAKLALQSLSLKVRLNSRKSVRKARSS